MKSVRVPSASDDWKVPYIAAGVVHFTAEIEEGRVRGIGDDN
jgi:hypothetical protein